MEISCGIIVDTPRGWLICHATGTTRWDLPKGRVEEGEDHVDCALRETFEETGLDLSEFKSDLYDLGHHKYIKGKDLHLYYLEYPKEIDVKELSCSSYVETERSRFPEVDYYDIVSQEVAMTRFGKGLRNWLDEHFGGF